MRALLDTHALLWMADGSERLSERAGNALLDEKNELVLSLASWWEIAIKIGLGKLELRSNWAADLKREMQRNGIGWLPLLPEHCERLPDLPLHHRDPFDRLLIAQALCENLTVVTSDPHFSAYDITVIW
jgi:PIN domain nuclease of toxin-antitoxin system